MGMTPENEMAEYESREQEQHRDSDRLDHSRYSDEPPQPKRHWWQFWRKSEDTS